MARNARKAPAAPAPAYTHAPAPAQAPTRHFGAGRKLGINFGGGTAVVALTPYGLAAKNPWGNANGAPVYAYLQKLGLQGATIGAIAAHFKAHPLQGKCTVHGHLRYLFGWGAGQTAYLAINGVVNGALTYTVRPRTQ